MANSFGPGDHDIHLRHGFNGVTSPYVASELRPDRPYLNYPPPHNELNPSFDASQTNLNKDKNGDVSIGIYTSRTPSPTPSEHALLNRKGIIDWKKMMNWRFWIRREWLWYYVILGIILIIFALVSIYDRQIVRALQPATQKIKNLPGGWAIPIAIFFVISFPPLFGHEILAILVGVVWGLWIGFAITAAGTFLGELGNFYAFKYCCRARGEKLEKKDLQYACLARTVREGGFKIALVARYSAIPGHFTTAVFSTCGMGVLVFALAAFLSLPKQFVTVYIGVILEESGTGTESTRDRLISYSVLAVTFIVTCVAMWYMYKKMDEVKVDVITDRRKARQGKLDRAQSLRGSSVFNPNESESDLPLNPGEDNAYQQWDAHGQAAGFSGDPRFSESLHAPTPRRADFPDVSRIPTYRTEGGGGYSTTGERYASPSADLLPSSSTSQSASPAHTPAVHRQESGDSVGWDAARTVGGEAYRLPTIQPQTPLSGGFVHVPLSAKNPFNRNPLQQAQQTGPSASPVPPPLIPPPPSNQRSANPYSPPVSPSQQPAYSLPSPTAQTFPQQVSTATASISFGSPVTTSPTTQPYPANLYSAPQSAPHSPLQTPTQHAFAAQPLSQVHPQMQSLPSPIQRAFVPYPPTGTPASPDPPSNRAGVGTHVQESSDATLYFTPAHSRYPTENQPERLPSPEAPPPEYRP
ncbi:hypothetical protein ACEPAI_6670 [Sanghuangporus weigelae]